MRTFKNGDKFRERCWRPRYSNHFYKCFFFLASNLCIIYLNCLLLLIANLFNFPCLNLKPLFERSVNLAVNYCGGRLLGRFRKSDIPNANFRLLPSWQVGGSRVIRVKKAHFPYNLDWLVPQIHR